MNSFCLDKGQMQNKIPLIKIDHFTTYYFESSKKNRCFFFIKKPKRTGNMQKENSYTDRTINYQCKTMYLSMKLIPNSSRVSVLLI